MQVKPDGVQRGLVGECTIMARTAHLHPAMANKPCHAPTSTPYQAHPASQCKPFHTSALAGEIIGRFEKKGFKLRALKMYQTPVEVGVSLTLLVTCVDLIAQAWALSHVSGREGVDGRVLYLPCSGFGDLVSI